MELQYFGHACVALRAASGQLLMMDPPEAQYGYPLPPLRPTAVTVSHSHQDHSGVGALAPGGQVVQELGSVQVGDFQIVGALAFHDGQHGAQRGEVRVYKVAVDGVTVAHLGDLGHPLTPELRSFLTCVDLLLTPVGGVFTIGAAQAVQVIREVRPRFAAPIHYRTEQGSLQQLGDLPEFIALWKGPKQRLGSGWQALPAAEGETSGLDLSF